MNLASFTVLISAFLADTPPVEIIQDGQPVGRIYVDGPISEELPRRGNERTPEALAAHQRFHLVQDLNYHLKRMSGTSLEVLVADAQTRIEKPAIVLGKRAVVMGAAPQKTTPSDDGFRIRVKNGLVLIGGQSDKAVQHGVYALLNRLGCEWVMPGEIGEIIPQRATISIPAIDESQAPDFYSRRLWYRGYNQPRLPEERARYEKWFDRQRGGTWSSMEGSPAGHVWDRFIKKHKAEFDKDPTMLALRRMPDGTMQRRGPQLEPSHPRVVELFIQDIKETYRRNIEAGKWTRETKAGFGIGPADGLGYSESAEATLTGAGRMDPIVGELDRTDELILLGNKILEAVTPEYPNAFVGCYSYSTHADYPARYKPHPNIVQIFAPINFSRYHSVLDRNSKTQSYYKQVVELWGKLSNEQGNPLIYRGYSWNLAENLVPYTKVRIWGEELPFYHQHGIRGLNVESTKMWGINGPSDFVFMKLAWDTSLDWRDVLRHYCEKSFGAGADQMQRYLLRLIQTQHDAGQEAGSYHAIHLIFDDPWVQDSLKDIDAAMQAATTDGDRTRIKYIRTGVEMLRLYLRYHKASLEFDFQAAQAAFQEMQQHWKTCYELNTDIVSNEAEYYLRRFLEKFVTEGVKYSSGAYRMVHRLPDELKTMFDPHVVGHRMGYHRPEINDTRFITTRTISTTWDAQGLTGIRSGAAWYRHHFQLPPDAKKQPLGLFIGGVEDEARVWINGHLIGSGRGFSRPFVFDLTDGINDDGDNLLAIQVVRNSKANEIGLGGLIRPSFIFTGPRLESKAPQPLELRRVLPGGELGDVE